MSFLFNSMSFLMLLRDHDPTAITEDMPRAAVIALPCDAKNSATPLTPAIPQLPPECLQASLPCPRAWAQPAAFQENLVGVLPRICR
eukprot:CAMPEP_0172061398 /NCGR_PEP_ID=MMETSP1043-20130122/8468_1 /TAXON_ID=464988 /ORGANISM="Hemiselmis andersenii, Strain CCMP441" /LENGTH=86 /DNA_ID=CAMNT_0012721211 /DNA_START=527 /DNA_END=787 /DNA_ORIENTATION=+